MAMSEFDFLKAYIDKLPKQERNDYFLRPSIGEAEIRQIESETGVVVPIELREFYRFSYGAKLSEYKILTISEIAELLSKLRKTLPKDFYMKDSILPFAYLVGVGDIVAFDLEQSSADGLLILDGFVEFLPDKWEGVCFGLKIWLAKMVENRFHPFWLKSR
jgi:hypothetical protein